MKNYPSSNFGYNMRKFKEHAYIYTLKETHGAHFDTA